ncbi:hypothetical protein ANN_21513 [Periplaneta americana]|uniref:Endonuclease/exonuclease/phosphatase domain-containing protein n=1 Tax=Periplaneta americana TaxID=6978 RepID=A0ABQ8SG83_PERAM|nr:hypothetical protein ANN_21513 [Periplaneta americana]
MKPGSGTPQQNSAATEICGTCMNDLTDDSNSVKYDSCHNRTHKKCAGLTQAELDNLKRPNCKLMWLCGDCKPKLKRLETIDDELSKLTNKVDMIVNLLSIQEDLSIEERIRNVISAELRAFETNIEEKVLSRMSQNIHPAITAKNDTQRGSTEAQEEEPKHVAIVKEKETSTEVTKTDVQEGNQHGEPIIRGDSSTFFGEEKETPVRCWTVTSQQAAPSRSGKASMLLWNIEGLNGVRNIMPVNIFKEDITILTETFLTKEVDLPGFYNYHVLANQGNMGRPSGGITCLVKPWLAPITVLKRTPNLFMLKTNCITIIGGYFQPEFSAQEIIEALNESIANTSTEEAVVIAGDFNCRTDIHNIKAAQTIAYLEQEGFKLINDPKEPTYISYNGASTIDLIFLNPRVTKISDFVSA